MTCETQRLPSFPPSYITTTTTTTSMKSSSDSNNSPRKNNDFLSSRDWMSDYKDSHVDVDYNRMPLLSSSSSTNPKINPTTTTGKTVQPSQSNNNNNITTATNNSSGETDWGAMFHKSIGTAPASNSNTNMAPPPTFDQRIPSISSMSMGGLLAPLPERSSSNSSFFKASVDFIITPSLDAEIQKQLESVDLPDEPNSLPKPQQLPTTDIASTIVALAEKNKKEEELRKQTKKAQRNKTKVNNRRFKEPIIKEYVIPTDNDVLLGRGGRSNHHPGNKAYRDEVGNIRDSYRTSEKSHKTDLSQMLVNWVQQERRGRFLKQDASKQWYVVTNIVARRKASQALREHMTKEEREAMKKQQTTT